MNLPNGNRFPTKLLIKNENCGDSATQNSAKTPTFTQNPQFLPQSNPVKSNFKNNKNLTEKELVQLAGERAVFTRTGTVPVKQN